MSAAWRCSLDTDGIGRPVTSDPASCTAATVTLTAATVPTNQTRVSHRPLALGGRPSAPLGSARRMAPVCGIGASAVLSEG